MGAGSLEVFVGDAELSEEGVHVAVVLEQEILGAASEEERRKLDAGRELFFDSDKWIEGGEFLAVCRTRAEESFQAGQHVGRDGGGRFEPAAEAADGAESAGRGKHVVERTEAAHGETGEHASGGVGAVGLVDGGDEFAEEEGGEEGFDGGGVLGIAAGFLRERGVDVKGGGVGVEAGDDHGLFGEGMAEGDHGGEGVMGRGVAVEGVEDGIALVGVGFVFGREDDDGLDVAAHGGRMDGEAVDGAALGGDFGGGHGRKLAREAGGVKAGRVSRGGLQRAEEKG